MLLRKNKHRRFIAVLALMTIALALTITTPPTSSAEAAEQVVFSGAGTNNFGAPFAFWVWCQAEPNGPYGHACAGAVAIPLQTLRVGVHGFVREEADETYTMHLFSNFEGALVATLHNVDPDPAHGPNNTVEFVVTTPIRTFHGSSTTAVVNVTGPDE